MPSPEVTQLSARDHLKDLLALDHGLTDWEVEFIENVNQWSGPLTVKQMACIMKIWDKHCSGTNT